MLVRVGWFIMFDLNLTMTFLLLVLSSSALRGMSCCNLLESISGDFLLRHVWSS